MIKSFLRIGISAALIISGFSLSAQNRPSFKAEVITPSAQVSEPVTVQHPWSGKKVLFIGDSISDCIAMSYVDKHYYDYLSDWLGITAYVPAISGMNWTHVETQLNLFKQTAGEQVPDMICIFLGTNDYNEGVPIGEWFTEEEKEVEAAMGKPKETFRRMYRSYVYSKETFKGRINSAIRLLKETYPTVPITLLTPIHRALFNFSDSNLQPEELYQNSCGEYLDAYVDAVKEASNVWSVNVIDLNADSNMFPLLDSDARAYYKDEQKDRLHPGELGHRRIAEVLLFRSLLLPCKP